MFWPAQGQATGVAGADHGVLSGLGDDDHTQYALADKTRPATWVASGDLSARSIADLGTKTHSLLTSLTADDHTQYGLLAGRAGGQTLIGGTAASNDLILQSTSNATRGQIQVNDLLDVAATTPTAAGHVGMDTVTGRMNAFIDGQVRKVAGHHETMMGTRSIKWMTFNAGTQTAIVSGMATQTSTGTQANIHTTDAGEYIRYTSSGTINTDAGWSPDAYDHTRRRYDPIWEAGVMAATTQTNTRTWFGMFSGDPMASATPALHYAAFRYDTATDGTAFWRCCTDGGGGAPTVTVTTVGYTALVGHRLKIVMNSLASTPAVRFYIDDVLVATHTTDLPGIDTDLAHHEELRDTAGAARQIHVNKVVWSAWSGPQ